MSWHPNDLVSDQDLVDYEQAVLTSFGQTGWQARRTKVLEDWLFPIVKANGFDPYRLRTRFQPDQVWGFTGAVYTDLTGAAGDNIENDINLATVLATVGTDAVYIGSIGPFRGLHWRFLDSVSAVASVATVSYWNDQWTPVTLTDRTAKVAGKTFSAGGSMTWPLLGDWTIRTLNLSKPLYWVKVTVTATPTGALATQIGAIRRSALAAPAALRTLMLIMREAPTGQAGPWQAKAEYYEKEADLALQRALPIIGGEFDMDDPVTPLDLISPTSAVQTSDEASGGGAFRLERG